MGENKIMKKQQSLGWIISGFLAAALIWSLVTRPKKQQITTSVLVALTDSLFKENMKNSTVRLDSIVKERIIKETIVREKQQIVNNIYNSPIDTGMRLIDRDSLALQTFKLIQ